MIQKKNFKLLFLLAVVACVQNMHARFATNLLIPFDSLTRPPFRLDGSRYHLDFFAEHGFNMRGYDICGACVPITQVNFVTQDALAMLDGFDPNTAIGQLAINLRADGAVNDGIRGHYTVCGDMNFNGGSIDWRVNFARNYSISAYLPFYQMAFKNVQWNNLTEDITSGDHSVREKLTDNFFANVFELGNGLDLGPWNRRGMGDLTLMLEWANDFPQVKPLLRNVRVQWRFGMSIPTGLQEDPNKILTIPFGGDGAFGLLAGLELNVRLGDYLRVGGSVDLHHFFGNTKIRRIKTSPFQTDFLLLQKACAYKDFGLNQRFDLYTEFINLRGFAFKIGYQYFKHGDDTLALVGQEFGSNLANTELDLLEFTIHQIVVNASYDFSQYVNPDSCVKPYLSLYTRIPVIGKRSVAAPVFGGVLSIDF
jgi:hypothetical protein